VITTALSTLVGAPRDRIWRALTDPAEIVRWDERAVQLLDPVTHPLAPGRVLRWRYLIGGVPLELREEIAVIVPEERLHFAAQLGLFRFEQTFTLADDAADRARTRLGLRMTAENAVPVVGGLLDRFSVRRQAADFVDFRLRALQKWCEASQPVASSG
jgi:uncharacterized protein YndB with AHSA1/START domain